MGELVREFVVGDSQSSVNWDVKNSKGDNLASGIFFGLVESKGKISKFKFAVER